MMPVEVVRAPPPAPADPSTQLEPFRKLAPGLCAVGAVTHTAFLALFIVTGVQLLVVVNIASIACYVIAYQLARRNRTRPIVEFGLIGGEVFAHAVIATLVLGWDSGFHYYILLLVPVTAVSTVRPVWLKTAAVAAAGLGYLGLDLWLRPDPAREISGRSLEYLYYFNVASALLILAALAGRYYLLIQQAQATLQTLATTDPLTQLNNRTSLDVIIQRERSRALRGHPLSFLMCDLDHFKRVNDLGGHAAGDIVLTSVSRSMAASIRAMDSIGRWGGEEFLIVLPDTDDAAAALIGERLRSDVESLAILIGGAPVLITVTVGASTLAAGESADAAIARADAALYDGKRAGRNRVIRAPAGGTATLGAGV